jgi:hypothetical protein
MQKEKYTPGKRSKMTSRRGFTAGFKAQVVLEILAKHKSAAPGNQEYSIKDSVLSTCTALKTRDVIVAQNAMRAHLIGTMARTLEIWADNPTSRAAQ